MNALPQHLMLDSDEAAQLSRVHRGTFLKHVREGNAPKPTARSGRKWLWPRPVILAYLGVSAAMLEVPAHAPAASTIGM